MRRVEIALICAAIAFPAFAQNSAVPNYNKTDTFEPGKKYNCVPSADHKGWDCSESGKAVEIKPKETEPPRQAAEPKSAPAPVAATPPPAPASPPPSQPTSRSTLPSYLTNAAASNPTPAVEEPPSTVSAAAAHANAPSPPRAPVAKPVATKPQTSAAPKPVAAAPAPTTRTVPLKPANPKPSAAATPPPLPPAKPAVPQRATHPPVVEAASAGGEFMSLPGDHFVVEMAHAASKSELDAVKSSTRVPSGDLYELRLRQNGADTWLLLWGSFDTIEAARAARNTISASATPGWPRRIAPLQAEARRASP